ncbi:uncharacterized protein PV07_10137 [Cladophialophora immunda]|uniref:Chromo domain-containing protein n=1 Tax=Cladophialophora immunda TaxID=569365 RepID=A0A0D2BZA3_9EURO|nr:uncharacterized protein PV07_10137 [Cladophialophora immunda]KIW24423.1 hypothetical protein PV07_10137 [Cladophialophora immunda]OQV02618.1 Chromo shadow domain-containing protein [Cladophialophora immunda]
MPHGFEDIDDADAIFHDPTDGDLEAEEQINGELKDQAEEKKEESDEEEAPVTSKDAGDVPEDDVKDGARGEDDASEDSDKEEEEDEEKEEEEEEGSEYSVEAIRAHKFLKGEVYYLIKWQGYGEHDNTWEPEDNLLPHARQTLAKYHKNLGGPPVPPVKRTKSKQRLRGQASSEDLPATKRRRRNNGDVSESPGDNPPEETVGTWLPSREDWESLVVKVEMVERDDAGQLLAYIRFKNGKRSKVGMDMVYRHCPRPMLRFYEEHLKFNGP